MSGFLLFGGILLVLLTAVVMAALRAAEDTGARLGPGERIDAAVEALRDLELEFQTGKLTSEEYRSVRARLEREALAARDAAGATGDDADPPDAGPSPGGETRACPDCSAPLEGVESFCPACGAPTGIS